MDGVADVAGTALAGTLNQIRKLKAKIPGLRTLASIGGASFGSDGFANATETPERRTAFVTSCINLLIAGDFGPANSSAPVVGGIDAALGVFDGIDVDW